MRAKEDSKRFLDNVPGGQLGCLFACGVIGLGAGFGHGLIRSELRESSFPPRTSDPPLIDSQGNPMPKKGELLFQVKDIKRNQKGELEVVILAAGKFILKLPMSTESRRKNWNDVKIGDSFWMQYIFNSEKYQFEIIVPDNKIQKFKTDELPSIEDIKELA